MLREPTILARLAGPLLQVCEPKLALEAAERFALEPEQLRDAEARIPLARFFDLLEFVDERSADAALGQRYSQSMPLESMGLIGFLALTAPDLGTVLDRMFRYQALISEGEDMTLERVGERVVIRMGMWGPPRPAHRIWSEAAVVDIVVNGRRVVAQQFEVLEVRLRHARARSPAADQLAALLDCPLRFDAEDYAVELPASALSLAMPSADASMFEYFDRQAALAHERIEAPQDLLTRITRAIEHALPEGVPAVAHVAARLHASPRTVQRRLQEHGTSMRALVDDTRERLARRYLAEGLSVAEVSFLLGFSQPSAFHRAFRRWTGSTPSEWRSRRLADAEPMPDLMPE